MPLKIAEPLTLPCGLVLPNRLVKAAMTEQMADSQYLPDDRFVRTYSRWGEGGWGMVLTGNLQVDATYLGQPRDTAVDPSIETKLLETWKAWAKACLKGGTPTIVQISHPGRQSMAGAGKKGPFAKNLAPSPVPLNLGDGVMSKALSSVLFGVPKEMTVEDIERVVDQFAVAARLVAESGFSGVQIHGAHGYLLAQFLSSSANQRSDDYGGTPQKRAKIVVDIVRAVRKVVPQNFAVGIKLNSVDHQSQQDVNAFVEQITTVASVGLDFIEISGGTYENPRFITGDGEQPTPAEKPPSQRTQAREAFFLEFANTIRSHFRSIPLIVTGGFRTRTGMEEALASEGCDLVGIGRPACIYPDAARATILNPQVPDADARLVMEEVKKPLFTKLIPARATGSGVETTYYSKQIQALAG